MRVGAGGAALETTKPRPGDRCALCREAPPPDTDISRLRADKATRRKLRDAGFAPGEIVCPDCFPLVVADYGTRRAVAFFRKHRKHLAAGRTEKAEKWKGRGVRALALAVGACLETIMKHDGPEVLKGSGIGEIEQAGCPDPDCKNCRPKPTLH